MYYREPRSPSPREQDTIKHVTYLAGIAIQRELVETARRESEAYLAEAQRLSHTGSWAWAPATGEIRYWSEETYRVLGFDLIYGGDDAAFTSFRAGTSYLNLIAQPVERTWSWWGRVIFYHTDVDSLHARVIAAGLHPDTAPRDAKWGERFFHLTDPDGHELSFAWPLRR